jgi:hypothetical protein
MTVGRDPKDAGGEFVYWLGVWMIPEMLSSKKEYRDSRISACPSGGP